MDPDSGTEPGPASTAVAAAPLLALGVIAALLIRACVPSHSAPAPAGAVPVFDSGLAAQLANHAAEQALAGLPPDASAALILAALNRTIIDFTPGSLEVPDSAIELLRHAARILSQRPAAERYLVTGHADGSGTPLSDLEWSRRYSQAVVDFLVSQGVAKDRLEARGAGDEQPLAAGISEEARLRNRRIEFSLLP